LSGLGDSLAALGEPEFRKLFIGQATSVVGSMFRVVAWPVAFLALEAPVWTLYASLADAFGRSTVLWVSAGVAIFVSLFQLAWRDVRAPHAMGPAAEPAAPPAV
jgi:hypothetical protein